MRGTPMRRRWRTPPTRIIPAHAGNTRQSATSHKCSCGSSPRMRGTLSGVIQALVPVRIIPAHAGNTLHASMRFARIWDHPRACGEHMAFCLISVMRMGSSPRMRGTPDGIRVWNCGLGIIPAHAGNTITYTSFGILLGDHPRACGEHSVLTRGY